MTSSFPSTSAMFAKGCQKRCVVTGAHVARVAHSKPLAIVQTSGAGFVSMDSGALRYVALKLTLGDLLRQPDLNLTLLTEDRAALTRPVLGAHSIEIAFPSRWVPRDWIMLTTGLRLRGRRDEQRQLIAELHEHGQAALGWGIGLVVQRVPRAVLSEANARSFPVFAV